MGRFHADDDAAERTGSSRCCWLESDLDLLAAGLIENLPETWVGAQIECKAFQCLFDRLLAIVAQGHGFALGVFDDQALDEVIDVGGRELQIDTGFAFNFARGAGSSRRRC